jgi:hypothetical protein
MAFVTFYLSAYVAHSRGSPLERVNACFQIPVCVGNVGSMISSRWYICKSKIVYSSFEILFKKYIMFHQCGRKVMWRIAIMISVLFQLVTVVLEEDHWHFTYSIIIVLQVNEFVVEGRQFSCWCTFWHLSSSSIFVDEYKLLLFWGIQINVRRLRGI